ncbi:MAG: sodium/solute symporter [Bacteroidetes bacterium]|nr:sodium/solute symporter [Bacteroidota bacterium]
MIASLKVADIIILAAGLASLVYAGVRNAKQEENASEYFMAGRNLPWWSVAGSIYGTNVSLSQIIGMLGIGYSIGFAQSHYELLAIPAILTLCHLFIPAYRRHNAFTLSQFLGDRYNESARILYTFLLLAIIIILLVGGLYIGSRQLGLLFGGTAYQPTYLQGIVLISSVSCLLVLFGGMHAVVKAENIITILMVLTVITVGLCTLLQPEIGGFTGLLKLDASTEGMDKMKLYLPSDHPDLPWTGVFSGLLVLHGFFWTTNQFEVQRALAARSDRDAQLGAIAAGFLKLTIPFFSISAGVAAAYLFKTRFAQTVVKPDDAFIYLLTQVVPQGFGLIGLILTGFIGAIFSSIYSMLNSLSTIVAVDLYQRHSNPGASDRQLVRIGRYSVVATCIMGGGLAWWSFDPGSDGNFFLTLSRNTSYFKPGIVSAFLLGILWTRVHRISATVAIMAAPILSVLVEILYAEWLSEFPPWRALFGLELNFLHRVFVVFVLCVGIQVLMTLTARDSRENVVGFTEWNIRSAAPLLWYTMIQLTGISLIFMANIPTRLMAWPVALISLIALTGKSPFRDGVRWWSSLLAAIMTWSMYYFA